MSTMSAAVPLSPTISGVGRRLTRVCAVSFKPCWQDSSGQWLSFGGFPLQMAAIASLFDEMTLVVEQGEPRPGGLPLPRHANVVALRCPSGSDLRRKISVML